MQLVPPVCLFNEKGIFQTVLLVCYAFEQLGRNAFKSECTNYPKLPGAALKIIVHSIWREIPGGVQVVIIPWH